VFFERSICRVEGLLGQFDSTRAIVVGERYGGVGRLGDRPCAGDLYGLITLADLNRREVRRAAYELLFEAERKLASLVNLEYPNPEAVFSALPPTVETARLKRKWDDLRRRGLDPEPLSFLGLPQLFYLFGPSLRQRIGANSDVECELLVKWAVEFRHCTMHPVRPLIFRPCDPPRFAKAAKALRAILA
jgi:hypothetical protein